MTTAALIPTESIASEIALPSNVVAFVDASLSDATRRAYRSGLRDFGAWADARGLEVLPVSPEVLASYLADLADQGRSVSTIEQRVAAIRWAHEAQGFPTPTTHAGVRSTLKGIRREKGVAPNQKAPATVERVGAMVAHADRATLKGKRDAALILAGFALAMRRSELVGLEVGDLEQTDRGVLVTLRRSKTDQEGKGHSRAMLRGKAAETCPVRALGEWMEAAGITSGRIFRSVTRSGGIGESLSARAVADVVKRHAKAAGLDPADFSGHSLRAGFVTSAAERGRSAERIMDHTGHASLEMVRRYTRRADAFADHAGEGLL